MKLYTEEQILNAYYNGWHYRSVSFVNGEVGKFPFYRDEFINSLTPIELPSDEEIEEIAFRRVNGLTDYLTPKELNCLREGYMNGMKLLINVIQGGNK